MAYSQGSTPLPPPPNMGGNRTDKHIIGGQTSNFGYSAGNNLAQARAGYQNGREGGYFRNSAEIRPQFNYMPKTTADAPLTAQQATGNQMRANTTGQIRPANQVGGQAGMGYQHYGGGIRQHTILDPSGAEYASMNLVAQPLPTAPPAATTSTGTGVTNAAPVAPVNPVFGTPPPPAPNVTITPPHNGPAPIMGGQPLYGGPADKPVTGTFGAQPVTGTFGSTSSGIFKTRADADAAWARNNMGAKYYAGGTRRTAEYAAYLRKHGFL